VDERIDLARWAVVNGPMGLLHDIIPEWWDMVVVVRRLERRGRMEDEAALSSSNKQEVFVKLLVISLTIGPEGKRRGWSKTQDSRN